jgi:hypothetical protein
MTEDKKIISIKEIETFAKTNDKAFSFFEEKDYISCLIILIAKTNGKDLIDLVRLSKTINNKQG